MKKTNILLAFLLISLVLAVPVNAGWANKFWVKLTSNYADDVVKYGDDVVKVGNKADDLIKQNKFNGLKWEKTVQDTICKQNRCLSNVRDLGKRTGTTYVTNDWGAKRFINQNFDASFNKRPDLLKIRTEKGVIKEIVPIDAKTSANAIKSNPAQKQAYLDLCKKAKSQGVSCHVEYGLPKSNVPSNSVGDVICMFAIGNWVPDPVDVVCFISVFV